MDVDFGDVDLGADSVLVGEAYVDVADIGGGADVVDDAFVAGHDASCYQYPSAYADGGVGGEGDFHIGGEYADHVLEGGHAAGVDDGVVAAGGVGGAEHPPEGLGLDVGVEAADLSGIDVEEHYVGDYGHGVGDYLFVDASADFLPGIEEGVRVVVLSEGVLDICLERIERCAAAEL